MLIKRVVVFSGIDTRVIERARRSLQASQITPIFQALPPVLDESYFSALCNRALSHIQGLIKEADSIIYALLISSLSGSELGLENKFFFPSLRRRQVPVSCARDINRANELSSKIILAFKEAPFGSAHKWIRPSSDSVALLPPRNTKSDRFIAALRSIYNMEEEAFPRSLDKEVIRLRGGRGLSVKGVTFRGCLNGSDHPVRRRSDCCDCDLRAAVRLGIVVPSRFELDVTTDGPITGKSFFQCDGRSEKVPSGISHLNMRINDDHAHGRK